MVYEEMTMSIRAACKRLLESKEADLIVAYRGGGLGGLQIPYIAQRPEDAANIEWGDRCYQNIAKYLLEFGDSKVGILAKPCDSRAVAQLMSEQQLKRENVHIIGVDCTGMVDEDGDPRPGCPDCTVRTPPLFDEHIRDDRADAPDAAESEAERAVDSEAERMMERAAGDDAEQMMGRTEESDGLAGEFESFRKEIDKCILCYACRQACYGCYCKTCFIERDLPDWAPAELDAGTKMTFHLGRTMHLAGRCIECGACEASCQSGVNVRYIIKEVTNFIEAEYGYSAGMDPDKPSALLENEFNDREIGFLGGETHA